MKPVGIPTPDHQPSGVFVDDQYLAVSDDVLLVLQVHELGTDRVLYEMRQFVVGRVVQVIDVELALYQFDPVFAQADRLGPIVDREMLILRQPSRKLGETLVFLSRVACGTADD